MNWKRAHQLVWEELDGGALLVNVATGARWSLNAAAAALWKLCDGRSTAQLAAALSRSRAHMAPTCRALAQLGLLGGQAQLAGCARISDIPGIRPMGGSGGSRRRPGPRGISGPA